MLGIKERHCSFQRLFSTILIFKKKRLLNITHFILMWYQSHSRAYSMEFPDPLSLFCCLSLLSITPSKSSRLYPVSTQSWYMQVLASTGTSMRWSPLEKITYEFVFFSSSVPGMSCSSYLDSLWDGRNGAKQLLFWGVLLLVFVQNSM